MGFGGSTSGANVSLKNNRRERKSKIGKYFSETGSKIEGIDSSHKISPEELKILKTRISSENKKRQLKILIVTAVCVIFILAVLGFFIFKKPL